MDNAVVLRDSSGADGTRHLEARLDDAGNLVVEGHDLGPGVTKIFGDDLDEYEWAYTVKKGAFPLLIKALGGAKGEDVLKVIADGCLGRNGLELGIVISENDVPHEFWNRIG